MKDINVPVNPYYRWIKTTDGDRTGFRVKLVCPSCHYRLGIIAPRCPECGQLFKNIKTQEEI